jgi:hypothetical protein
VVCGIAVARLKQKWTARTTAPWKAWKDPSPIPYHL